MARTFAPGTHHDSGLDRGRSTGMFSRPYEQRGRGAVGLMNQPCRCRKHMRSKSARWIQEQPPPPDQRLLSNTPFTTSKQHSTITQTRQHFLHIDQANNHHNDELTSHLHNKLSRCLSHHHRSSASFKIVALSHSRTE